VHITTMIRTSYGRRRLPTRPMIRVCLSCRELDALIHLLDRDAMQPQQAGRFAEADRLALRAATPRNTAR
jgi:hypothetical protein